MFGTENEDEVVAALVSFLKCIQAPSVQFCTCLDRYNDNSVSENDYTTVCFTNTFSKAALHNVMIFYATCLTHSRCAVFVLFILSYI